MSDVVTNFDLAKKQKDPFFYRVRVRHSDDEFEGPFLLRETPFLEWAGSPAWSWSDREARDLAAIFNPD